MLDAALASVSLGNGLTGKWVVKCANGIIQADEGVSRVAKRQNFLCCPIL